MSKKVVVIGSGMAGGKFVEELLNLETNFEITVIGDEPVGNYNRIKLLYKLIRDEVEDFFINDEAWYKAHDVRSVFGAKAQRIDSLKKQIHLSDGKIINYDIVVIATGSKPFIPQMSGLDLPGVGVLRNIADVDRVKKMLDKKTDVMVIGGGLLGLELALILRSLGKRVTVSHLMKSLMETQLSLEAAQYLQKTLEGKGMQFIMGTYVTDLLGTTEGVETAVFKDGRHIPAEAVLFSTGIKPEIELARASEIPTNKGILVNNRMQSTIPDVYAVGECIEFEGRTWGLVAPVYDQCRVAAAAIAGKESEYKVSALPVTRLKSDIPVISMGLLEPQAGDDIIVYQDPKSLTYKRLITRGEILVGATLIGEDLNADAIGLHYTAKIPIPGRAADLLFPGAKAGEEIMDATHWPDDLMVCDCVGVTTGKLRTSIAKGNDTLTKLMNATKAGTGCGQCKSKIKAVLIGALGELREDPTDRFFVPGIPLGREALSNFILENNIRTVSEVLAKVPESKDDPKTRLGLDYLLQYLWKGEYHIERDSQSANDRYGGNFQKDGRFSVIPHMSAGLVDAKDLRAIADVADEYKAKIKVTGADRIGLFSIKKEDLPEVWEKLEMKCGHAFSKTFRAAKACVGSTYCRFGLANSLKLGSEMSDRYRGMSGPAKLKMGISGCPRNCSEATIKDFGVIAVDDGWDLYIGGNAGGHVVASKKIGRVKTDAEVIAIADRFYEFYRKHGKYGERTAYFVERVGLQTIVEAILYDSPENLAKLEADFQKAVTNYKDPWQGGVDIEETIKTDYDHDAQYDQVGAAKKSKVKVVLPPDGKIKLGSTDQVPAGENRKFDTPYGDIVVFHGRDGNWAASESRCPHAGGPMVDSHFASGRLTCPLHSFSFDMCTGSCNNAEVKNLRTFKVNIDGGLIEIYE